MTLSRTGTMAWNDDNSLPDYESDSLPSIIERPKLPPPKPETKSTNQRVELKCNTCKKPLKTSVSESARRCTCCNNMYHNYCLPKAVLDAGSWECFPCTTRKRKIEEFLETNELGDTKPTKQETYNRPLKEIINPFTTFVATDPRSHAENGQTTVENRLQAKLVRSQDGVEEIRWGGETPTGYDNHDPFATSNRARFRKKGKKYRRQHTIGHAKPQVEALTSSRQAAPQASDFKLHHNPMPLHVPQTVPQPTPKAQTTLFGKPQRLSPPYSPSEVGARPPHTESLLSDSGIVFKKRKLRQKTAAEVSGPDRSLDGCPIFLEDVSPRPLKAYGCVICNRPNVWSHTEVRCNECVAKEEKRKERATRGDKFNERATSKKPIKCVDLTGPEDISVLVVSHPSNDEALNKALMESDERSNRQRGQQRCQSYLSRHGRIRDTSPEEVYRGFFGERIESPTRQLYRSVSRWRYDVAANEFQETPDGTGMIEHGQVQRPDHQQTLKINTSAREAHQAHEVDLGPLLYAPSIVPAESVQGRYAAGWEVAQLKEKILQLERDKESHRKAAFAWEQKYIEYEATGRKMGKWEENKAVWARNKKLSELNQSILTQNKNLREQNEDLLLQKQQLSEGYETLLVDNRRLAQQNKKSLETQDYLSTKLDSAQQASRRDVQEIGRLQADITALRRALPITPPQSTSELRPVMHRDALTGLPYAAIIPNQGTTLARNHRPRKIDGLRHIPEQPARSIIWVASRTQPSVVSVEAPRLVETQRHDSRRTNVVVDVSSDSDDTSGAESIEETITLQPHSRRQQDFLDRLDLTGNEAPAVNGRKRLVFQHEYEEEDKDEEGGRRKRVKVHQTGI